MKRTVADYEARLATRTAKWIAEHAEEHERIQRSIVGFGKPNPEPGTFLRDYLDRAVAAEIRTLNEWPNCASWMAEKPALIDHKAIAAGDR